MPSCILTGATGYIGSHVARHLLDNGWEVAIISQPHFGYENVKEFKSRLEIFEYNQDMESLIEFFKEKKADVVMHLAAAVITNPTPQQVPTLIKSNIEFGTEILEAMRYSSTRLFIGTGTYWQNYNSDSYNPVDLYAATKEAFEKILQYYVDAFNFRAITLRLFDVYGEDDKRPKLWTFLRDIAGTNQSIDISAGEQYISLVHVEDIANAYESAYNLLRKDMSISNNIYGVCSDNMLTLKETIGIFQKVINKKINLNWGARPYKEREVMTPVASLQPLPNWIPNITLKNGFERFIK